MAGHNKWSKVKHIKGAADAKRGRIFSKLSKEISLAARSGGDPAMNARLRSAINAAKAQNMPGDTIERAVKKGTGELGGAAIEEIVYEGYGPGGAALLIEVATDNRNRAANDLRSLLTKNNGTFADAGSVAYMFQRKGEIRLDKAGISEDALMEAALDAGADDVQDDGEEWVVYTPTDKLFAVAGALRDKNINSKAQSLIYVPATTIPVADLATAKQLLHLHEILDDYDDTQNVYANFEISDDLLAQLN